MKKLEILDSNQIIWSFIADVKSNIIHDDGVYFYDENNNLVASVPNNVTFRLIDKK